MEEEAEFQEVKADLNIHVLAKGYLDEQHRYRDETRESLREFVTLDAMYTSSGVLIALAVFVSIVEL